MGIRKVIVTGFVAVTLFAGCNTKKDLNHASKINSQGTRSLSVTGSSAVALFQLLKESGVQAETIDGHVIMGATSYKADSIHCMTIMNAEQTKKCAVSKAEKILEVDDQSVALNAVAALDEMGVRVDADLIGALNYEISNINCTRPMVRNPVITCYYDKRAAVMPATLNAEQSDTIFDAMAGAGVKPETIDGQLPLGATTLKANQIFCSIISDANRTRTCGVLSNGQVIEISDSDTIDNLLDLLGSIGAAVNPELIGAANFQVNNVGCSKVVYPGAHASCVVQISK